MGGSAPAPDPARAEAALMSAKTGQDMLKFMQGQAEISNAWAKEDRRRWSEEFKPTEDKFIADAANYDTAGRRAEAGNAAAADVTQAMQSTMGQQERRNAALGVRPGSGRSTESTRRSASDMGLAIAGAKNSATRNVEAQGYAREANAVNMGKGYSVNPAQSLGMGTSSGAAGFQGAQQGYGQQAGILGAMDDDRMRAYESNQGALGGFMGGLGTIAGYGLQAGWLSSEGAKKNKSAAKGSLGAVRDMRVDNWDYKEGQGDGGRHVGPYAEEFAEKTGLGDGKMIKSVDAIGVALGAIKELDAKVEKLAA